MRLVDVGLAMPRVFMLLMVVALWEHVPLTVLVLLIGLTGWFGTSRLVRAEVLSVREREFVAAARALGAEPARVIFRHVLPNAAAPIIVSAALGIGNVMLLEAGLSFLGLGVSSPSPPGTSGPAASSSSRDATCSPSPPASCAPSVATRSR